MKRIFRDDDIAETTNVERFKFIDSFFKKYSVDHYIAIIVNGFANNKELVEYIKDNPHIKPHVHGWDHIDYMKEPARLKHDLLLCKEELEKSLGQTPTIWFPPWNHADELTIRLAKEAGFETSYVKASLSYYVQNMGNIEYDVLNLHYWADSDTHFLDTALKIYTNQYV